MSSSVKPQSSLTQQAGMQAVDLTKLNLMQLSKFQESGESLSRMKSDRDGCDVLVPLTGSMYVPGKLSNPDKVVVDIGTGYYVEKNSKDAQDYFNRKVKYVTENMERVQAIGMEKNKIRELVMDVMRDKLKAQFSQVEASKSS